MCNMIMRGEMSHGLPPRSRDRLEHVRRFATTPADESSAHMYELDKTRDIERKLEPTHAIQGWCPPIEQALQAAGRR